MPLPLGRAVLPRLRPLLQRRHLSSFRVFDPNSRPDWYRRWLRVPWPARAAAASTGLFLLSARLLDAAVILGALVLAAVRAYRWLGRDAFVSARSVVASQAGSKGRRPSDGVGTENAELEFDGTKLARRAAEALFPGLGRDAKETAERMEKTAREKVASSRAVRDVFGRVEVLVGPVERESVEEEGRLRVGFQVVGSRRAGMVWVEATAASVEEVEALWKLGRLSQVLMEVESVPGQLMAVDDEEEIGPGEDEQAGVREIEVKAERVEGAKEEPR